MRITKLEQLKNGDRIKVKGNMNVWVEGYARIEPNAYGDLTGIFFYPKDCDETTTQMTYIPAKNIDVIYLIETVEPRGIRKMKVGDKIRHWNGEEAEVAEVLPNVFAVTDPRDPETKVIWQKYSDATGWHLKDSKEVIYEDRDGERETLRTNCVAIDNTSKYPGHGTWTSKEVEEEDELTGDDIESLKTIINHMPIDGLPSDYRGASISYLDMKLNKLLKKRK